MRKILFLLVLLTLLPASQPAASADLPQARSQITLSFAPLVKQAAPAVVNIYARRAVQQHLSPLLSDPFFRQFFGDALPPGFSRERLENSLGSGVIVRPDGLIVTSNHVIAGADQIRVVLGDRREFDAAIVTSDEQSDLAILRINAKGEKLPYLELKNSDDAEVGDLVLAIGDPFGVGQTVTSGIISALAHGAMGAGAFDYYIQTDAAINPGNSGGALITMDGKLVGINASIYSRDGGNLGIGFAVPSNMVRVVLKAVESGKKSIVRPWLGVEGQAVTPALAASLGLSQPSGFLINSIDAASPAGTAGLQVGDVVTAIDGKTVEDPDAFHYRLATLPIGDIVDLGVMRKGQSTVVHVNLIAPPESTPRDKTVITGRNPLTGATLENMSPAVAEELNLHGVTQGAVITDIKDDSIASSIGVLPGDVIFAINGHKTPSVKDVLAAIKDPSTSWRVTVQRAGGTLTIMVRG